jgi:hypothetical protein
MGAAPASLGVEGGGFCRTLGFGDHRPVVAACSNAGRLRRLSEWLRCRSHSDGFVIVFDMAIRPNLMEWPVIAAMTVAGAVWMARVERRLANRHN